MRRIILMLMIFIGFASIITAQDAFYYCGSRKVDLKEISGKEVLITSSSNAPQLEKARIASSREIKDKRIVAKVVSSGTTSSMKKISKYSEIPLHAEKCYVDAQGLELFPTGYINVKLKREDDFDILKKRCSENNLVIIEQDTFMPLWYVVAISLDTEESVIDISNRLYELNDFEDCSPAFSFNPFEISYDPNVDEQWGLYNYEYDGIDINIAPAWD